MTNYKHLDIDVVNELKAVNELSDLENIVDELASHKMSLLSVPHADNEMQEVREEIIHAMETVVRWINDRLESGFWGYDMVRELKEQKWYLMECLQELKYMLKHSITVNFQLYEDGKRWEDTPTKIMTIQALNEQDCRSIAYKKIKELSDLEETEIRYTINYSTQGHYVGSDYTFRNHYKGGSN
ncbi:hypothetical protein NXG04_07955 [Klebsiella pneumoniae]|nr:hypothetical protein [Klebsiella pneumoniae]MDS7714489.1 hypothetical protein [Klebsiella pneumoniae]